MENQENNSSFLVTYRVKEDAIQALYCEPEEKKFQTVSYPNEVGYRTQLEQCYQRQYWQFRNRALRECKITRGISIGNTFLLSLVTGISWQIPSMRPLAFLSGLACCQAVLSGLLAQRRITRFYLTDACIQYASQMTFSLEQESSHSLSPQGERTFQEDGGFSSPHSFFYTNRDLKTLKKSLGPVE